MIGLIPIWKSDYINSNSDYHDGIMRNCGLCDPGSHPTPGLLVESVDFCIFPLERQCWLPVPQIHISLKEEEVETPH